VDSVMLVPIHLAAGLKSAGQDPGSPGRGLHGAASLCSPRRAAEPAARPRLAKAEGGETRFKRCGRLVLELADGEIDLCRRDRLAMIAATAPNRGPTSALLNAGRSE